MKKIEFEIEDLSTTKGDDEIWKEVEAERIEMQKKKEEMEKQNSDYSESLPPHAIYKEGIKSIPLISFVCFFIRLRFFTS